MGDNDGCDIVTGTESKTDVENAVRDSGESSSKKSYLSIQILRGIAALLVVLVHLAARELTRKNTPHILYLFSSELIGFFAVDTFFIISGFVMCTAHYHEFSNHYQIKIYLQKRFIRLFPLYWLTCISIILIKHLPLNSKLLGSLLLIPRYAGKINTVAWTLGFELIFLLMFAAFMLFPRKALPYLMGAWLICILAGAIMHAADLNDLGYLETFVSPFNIDFLLGIGLSLLVKNTKLLSPPSFLAVGLIASFAAVPMKSVGIWFDSPFGHVVHIAVPSFLIMYGLLGLEKRGNTHFPSLLILLGDASYSIYLVHYVLIATFASVWLQVGAGYSMVFWSLTTALIIPGVCVLNYICVEKPMDVYLRQKFLARERSR